MKTKTANLLGTALIALGFLMFFLMVYCIVAWGPAFCSMMFVIMLMLTGGAMLMMRRPAGPSMSEAAKLPDDQFADGRRSDGTGNGYCPFCGSPLSKGESYCGACGKRLRSQLVILQVPALRRLHGILLRVHRDLPGELFGQIDPVHLGEPQHEIEDI